MKLYLFLFAGFGSATYYLFSAASESDGNYTIEAVAIFLVVIFIASFPTGPIPEAKTFKKKQKPKHTCKRKLAESLDSSMAGDIGEALTRDLLKSLSPKAVHGFISSSNIVFKERNFEIDFLVPAPKIGLLLIEVKYYSGGVLCDSSDEWHQINSNHDEVLHKNASKQVLRTKDLLTRMLHCESLALWPITPVVVFAHPESRIFQSKGDQSPQTDVITLKGLEDWIENQPRFDNITFNADQYKDIQQVIRQYEKTYEANAA